MEVDSTERFAGKADDYRSCRPSYPDALYAWVFETTGLPTDAVIADVGSGTGFLSELFLKQGNPVFGVEPNADMRLAGELYLQDYPEFRSIDASAEGTTLTTQSCDLMMAGQAFHWFNPESAKLEFKRVLKPNGWVLLVWNTLVDSPLVTAYQDVLKSYNPAYQGDGYKRTTVETIESFLGCGRIAQPFDNTQMLDETGFIRRVLSSSYAPIEMDKRYADFCEKLKVVFERYHDNGLVMLAYKTEAFIGRL